MDVPFLLSEAQMRRIEPYFPLSHGAPRAKFALLGIATIIAGWLHMRQPGWRGLAGGFAIAGGLGSVVGVFAIHAWVLKGLTIGWPALAIAAVALSFRRSEQAPDSAAPL